MSIKKYIGFLVFILTLAFSSCQKQTVVPDAELFDNTNNNSKIYSIDDSFNDENINDDEDEDDDPDGDENTSGKSFSHVSRKK